MTDSLMARVEDVRNRSLARAFANAYHDPQQLVEDICTLMERVDELENLLVAAVEGRALPPEAP